MLSSTAFLYKAIMAHNEFIYFGVNMALYCVIMALFYGIPRAVGIDFTFYKYL